MGRLSRFRAGSLEPRPNVNDPSFPFRKTCVSRLTRFLAGFREPYPNVDEPSFPF